MRKLIGPRLAAAVVAFALLAAGCGVTAGGRAGHTHAELVNLRFLVPNTPGGGFDLTARTAVKAMEEAGIARGVEVFNLVGAGGTVGLARLVNERGNDELIMMMGLGVVGSVYTNQSDATLENTTPLANLIEEPGSIVVPSGSPFQTLDDFIQAWRADPGSVTIGGGSSPGGPDHLLLMQLAQAVGINVKDVNYVGYEGGGELLPAILGSQVVAAASGVGEYLDQVQAGAIRVLAVTSEKPLEGVDAPTLTEQGIDLVFANWRGVVAPPGIDEAARDRLIAALDQLHASPQWQEALVANRWTDAYTSGDEFATFIREQTQRVAGVLTELGLA